MSLRATGDTPAAHAPVASAAPAPVRTKPAPQGQRGTQIGASISIVAEGFDPSLPLRDVAPQPSLADDSLSAASTAPTTVGPQPPAAAGIEPEPTPIVAKPVAKPEPTPVVAKPVAKPEPAPVVAKPVARPESTPVVAKPIAKPEPVRVARPVAVEEAESATNSESLPQPEAEPVEAPSDAEEAVAPPQPRVDTTRTYTIDEIDRAPLSLATQLPVYTSAALEDAREGSVRMNVLVGADGKIDAVRLINEIEDSDLNRAAVTAVLHWRFQPGSYRGTPVRVWVPVRLDFSLSDDRMRSVVSIVP